MSDGPFSESCDALAARLHAALSDQEDDPSFQRLDGQNQTNCILVAMLVVLVRTMLDDVDGDREAVVSMVADCLPIALQIAEKAERVVQ